MNRFLLVFDGDKWRWRRVASITHNGERDEMIYHCDQPLAAPEGYDHIRDAISGMAKFAHRIDRKEEEE